jgi:hypothetical protein
MRRPQPTSVFVGAATFGLVAGWLWARHHDVTHREDLFSALPHRRFSALGWLAAEDSGKNLPLLRDYIAWEPVAVLRRRAERLIAALQVVA